MARRQVSRYYAPWPQVRIEHPSGYVQISLDYLVHGPKKKTSNLYALAKKNNGWKLFRNEAEVEAYERQKAQKETRL